MKIQKTETKEVDATTIKVYAKVGDSGTYTLLDNDGQVVHKKNDAYVPGFFPEQHYGDYLRLDIDLETGRILNWKTPAASDVSKWMENDE